MQLVRMVFGAQNVEVSNVSWLSGGIAVTPSLMLPYNRIAIIGFTIAVLLLLVFLLNKTRFGLFVRAVTQNRQMARAVGIRSARIDMMAFGLGSGLAGLAGCALAQVGNVGPDLGQNYIIDALLATFGVSLILMQLVRMVFGAQNVEVSNVSWLSGGIAVTPSLMLPYNRIAIIGFTIAVLLLLVFLLNKTRFGLFVRAVTQNRQMARAVGIRSARIDMMAFGLGSGLAGLAGCALAQVGNVGPDLGQNYIIDAFLVVVVGGVGQVWGAVLAALGLGISGTVLEIGLGAVLAKIILLVLVILFIQKRPQGLFAIKGRFVE